MRKIILYYTYRQFKDKEQKVEQSTVCFDGILNLDKIKFLEINLKKKLKEEKPFETYLHFKITGTCLLE